MHRLHDLRLIRLRPTKAQDRAAKVIALQVRRAARLERQEKHKHPARPDAA
jgi:hypothetical protein